MDEGRYNKIKMYSVFKGRKEIEEVDVDRVSKLYVYITNRKNFKPSRHLIKGYYRRFYDTKISANKAALNGW